MCDTFTFFSTANRERSFFAKNSDRDPGEPQVIEMIQDAKQDFKSAFLKEHLPKYQRQLEVLKKVFPEFEHPYSAIISRPTWIWGAEMGINEKGVSIGNEAIFSKEKTLADGLLGMDILRIALHNADSAEQAFDIITHLLETYGQGGNGSYSGTLMYHNSFLIKDAEKAIVIETSGKNWVRKDITDFASISNCYTINTDHSRASSPFKDIALKKTMENRFYTFFSRGDMRHRYTEQQIADRDKGIEGVFDILRSHIDPGKNFKKGMGSICVHPGTIVKSETTSSMVVDYYGKHTLVWVTSSPNPCVSLFKPLLLTEYPEAFPQFSSLETSLEYFMGNRAMAEEMLRNNKEFHAYHKTIRDALQREFLDIIYKGLENKTREELIADCNTCYAKEQEYLQQMDSLATK
ncbi:carcinine hydrolase/isopenicillin-N N-acyltransferase family protein [Robertkochia flava]|uniref:carcinine hydrolase/isopenicillin-N N-acyltransferase family protein n=1 Tax=Robertkochia flava TaxID=3447986 RepID=UPI001CCEB845|nr:carcinine hydrolase/isopenicillin-N N-acyltransferase family protein [Robertkochia marina]